MQKIRISIVSYLNTLPFKYGLISAPGLMDKIILSEDIPSVCADKLANRKVDIGLVPAAVLATLKNAEIISDYCIGAEGDVASVLLVSEVPIAHVKAVLLDYQSRTSIQLIKILMEKHWNQEVEWKQAGKGFEKEIGNTTAGVIIGDRTFGLPDRFMYRYDLAGEWFRYSGLPFVFACWVANRHIETQFIDELNSALKYGIEHIDEAVAYYRKNTPNAYIHAEEYLRQNVSYPLDAPKQKAMKLFLSYLS